MQLKEQDDNLSVLESSVSRLSAISLDISREIKDQNRKLDDMDADMDKAQDKADVLTRKTRELVKNAGYDSISCALFISNFRRGPGNFYAIIILSAVLVILIFLVIYT